MGLLARIVRPSELTHGRLPYSSLLSPGGLVPMVPKLISWSLLGMHPRIWPRPLAYIFSSRHRDYLGFA
jgi:hypothetical protein